MKHMATGSMRSCSRFSKRLDRVGVMGFCLLAMLAAWSPARAEVELLATEVVHTEGGEYTRFIVTLQEAIVDDQPVTLHLGHQKDEFKQAWATVPGLSQVRGDVDASGLRLSGDRLHGTVKASIRFPGEDQFHDATYELDLSVHGERVNGDYDGWHGIRGRHLVVATGSRQVSREDLSYFTYGQSWEGRIEGGIEHRARDFDRYELELNFGSVLIGGPADRFRRVGAMLRMRDGELELGDVYGTDLYEDSWSAEIDYVNLELEDDRLHGELAIKVDSGDGTGVEQFGDGPIPPGWRGPIKAGRYMLSLDGRIRGNVVQGTLSSEYEGLEVPIPARNFSGTITMPAQRSINRNNGVYTLTLKNAIEQSEDLRVQLDRRDGEFIDAIAIGRGGGGLSPADASDLTLEGIRLRGDLVVELQPGSGYLPGDEPLTVRFPIDAWIDRGWRGYNYGVAGWYEVTYGQRNEVAGKAEGDALDGDALRRADGVRRDLGWPFWHGPDGTFAAHEAGHELVESLDDAQLVWKSEATLPARSQITRYRGRNVRRELDQGPTGGGASVVVADGRVYFFYFRPTGESALQSHIRHETAVGRRVVPDQWRAKADDIVLCIDAATGQTLWKTTYRKGGIYWEPGKDVFTATPAVADGRIFALGTSGWVYALDAETGQRLWEQPLPWAQGVAQRRREAIEKNEMVSGSPVRGAARIVVDDVLITPDYHRGLIAFDVQTGKKRWHAGNSGASAATPVAWHDGNRAFVISPVDHNGQVVCLDVATGEEVWRIEDAGTSRYDLAVAEDVLVLQRGSGEDKRLAAYRISPEGFEEAWSLSPELGGIDGRPVVIHNGVVYAQLNSGLTLIDLHEGEVLAGDNRRRGSGATMVWAEGRLFEDIDATHSRTWQRMFDARPDRFTVMHEHWDPPHRQTSSYYRRVLSHPIVDGRIFLRGAHGIYCYDLRAAQ